MTIYDRKHTNKILYEALDERGRPLCLLPIEEILRQNLYHKTIALFLMDKKGRILLQSEHNDSYDFSFFGPIPVPLARNEFAKQVAFDKWKVEKLLQLCSFYPCPENRYSFCTIYKLHVSNALTEMFAQNKQKFLLADIVEISSLIKYDFIFSPFLKLFLDGDKSNI